MIQATHLLMDRGMHLNKSNLRAGFELLINLFIHSFILLILGACLLFASYKETIDILEKGIT